MQAGHSSSSTTGPKPALTPPAAAASASAGTRPSCPTGSPADHLEVAQKNLRELRHLLQQHERRYPPERRQAALLLGTTGNLARPYARQDALRRSLAHAERAWSERPQSRSDAGGSPATVETSLEAPASSPTLTQWPHERRVAHLSADKQASYLAGYLELGYTDHKNASGSTLALSLARPTPLFSPAPPLALGARELETSAAGESVSAKGKEKATEMATHLISMRDQQQLSPRDATGMSLAIATQAAVERVHEATAVVKQSMMELDVPDDVAKVFGEKPNDYFALPLAEHAFFDAVLSPSVPALNLLGRLETARSLGITEPSASVLRYEDASQQKYVFIRTWEPALERAGLVTLQQTMTSAHNGNPTASYAWRVLDRHKFRSPAVRHLPDTIVVGASKRLNRLQLRKEIRDLLGDLRTLVKDGVFEEGPGVGRRFVLGHPPFLATLPSASSNHADAPEVTAPPSGATRVDSSFERAPDLSLKEKDGRQRRDGDERGRPLASASSAALSRHRRTSSNASSAVASSSASPRRSLDDDGIFAMSSPERQGASPSPLQRRQTFRLPPSPTTPTTPREHQAASPLARPPSRAAVRPPIKSALRPPSVFVNVAQRASRPAQTKKQVQLAVQPQIGQPSAKPSSSASSASNASTTARTSPVTSPSGSRLARSHDRHSPASTKGPSTRSVAAPKSSLERGSAPSRAQATDNIPRGRSTRR